IYIESSEDLNVTSGGVIATIIKSFPFNGRVDSQINKSKKLVLNASFDRPNILRRWRKIKIPKDVYWYQKESQWRGLVEDVIDQNIKEFHLNIEYHSNFGIDSSLLLELHKHIKADVKISNF